MEWEDFDKEEEGYNLNVFLLFFDIALQNWRRLGIVEIQDLQNPPSLIVAFRFDLGCIGHVITLKFAPKT